MNKTDCLLWILVLAVSLEALLSLRLKGNRYEVVHIVLQDKIQENSYLLQRIQVRNSSSSTLRGGPLGFVTKQTTPWLTFLNVN